MSDNFDISKHMEEMSKMIKEFEKDPSSLLNPVKPKVKTIQQIDLERWIDLNCDCNGVTISDADNGL